MSWRSIQDTVPLSESLSRVSSGAERLYWRILSQTDSWGRTFGSAAKVRAACVPLVDCSLIDVEGWLRELEGAGRIFRYSDDGGLPALQVTEFDENQSPDLIRFRGKSKFSDYHVAPRGTTDYHGEPRGTTGNHVAKPESAHLQEITWNHEVPRGTTDNSIGEDRIGEKRIGKNRPFRPVLPKSDATERTDERKTTNYGEITVIRSVS